MRPADRRHQVDRTAPAAPPQYQLTDACIAAVRAERAAGYPQRELGRLVGLSPVLLSD